ncbi:hypothetical protein ECG_03610 [Echinococcus granulosus]|nr:hypothetical protein ECG_03610 [Echinococcus granulosus]
MVGMLVALVRIPRPGAICSRPPAGSAFCSPPHNRRTAVDALAQRANLELWSNGGNVASVSSSFSRAAWIYYNLVSICIYLLSFRSSSTPTVSVTVNCTSTPPLLPYQKLHSIVGEAEQPSNGSKPYGRLTWWLTRLLHRWIRRIIYAGEERRPASLLQ